MKWFKMLWLNSEERRILQESKKEVLRSTAVSETAKSEDYPIYHPAYKNLYYSNGNLTVIFNDGTMVSKSGVDSNLFFNVKNAQTQKEVENLLIDKIVAPISDKVETPEERNLVADNLDILKHHPDFLIQGNQVILKGVNLPIPASILSSFIEILERIGHAQVGGADSQELTDLDDQYEALKMFWLKLALNALPQSREDLLLFIKRNDVRITRNGNLILYRRIVTKTGADVKLVAFVSQNYYRIKKEGSDPRQFAITNELGVYHLVDLNEFDPSKDRTPFCNLQQMYLELPTYDTNTFTSSHDKSVEIKIGGIYRIPEKKINLDNGICSAGGLHAACVTYNYSGFGDTPVVVLVNPSKTITVPLGDAGKLRTTEMFVACVNDKPAGQHFDESTLSVFDEEYHDLTLDELEQVAKNKNFGSLSIEDNVPAISLVDLKSIKEMLKERIKEAEW